MKTELYLDVVKPSPAMLKSMSVAFVQVIMYGVLSMSTLIGTRGEYHTSKWVMLLL